MGADQFKSLIEELRKTRFIKSLANLKALMKEYGFELTADMLNSIHETFPSSYDEQGKRASSGRFVQIDKIQ